MYKILLVFVSLFVVPSAAYAQKITPNHVYQITEDIKSSLDKIHSVNYSKVPQVSAETEPRKPRHVLQLASTIFLKVQALRYLNGLSPKPLGAAEVRNVSPGDVKVRAELVLNDIKELYGAYGITDDGASAPLPKGKSPTDVYNNLLVINASVETLGIPNVVPNDVYQVAATLVSDLNALAGAGNPQVLSAGSNSVSGKSPGDVYSEATRLLQEIKMLSETNKSYAIAGGLVIPTLKSEKISPADVLKLLNTILADVGSMKVTKGMSKPTKLAQLEGGKTPSDVFYALSQARKIVASLDASQGDIR